MVQLELFALWLLSEGLLTRSVVDPSPNHLVIARDVLTFDPRPVSVHLDEHVCEA